ncbi:lytic transglycosylase domain-containing protein [Microbacterium sp. SLBN-146]|uniref:lytic transglycosylase domain-containing protein n=1 Tax=Microbacterium sp. SLBN-146 TaxID=2768457 RepID=UPI001170588B|nr:lytic transglycosylase domain-containing protein [Microbacterium sp. SLBN-146]TQJ31969.1 transglycosylase-like protein with SLT domain [Microbacterium sp. SLBN-146]
MLSVFAGFAAIGFVAAYAGPTGMAIAEAANAEEPTSLYATALDDVQTYEGVMTASAAEAEGLIDLGRGGYSVYVTPTPTPTPTPTQTSRSSGGQAAQPAPPGYTGGGSPAEWMAAAGIAEADWGYVDFIVRKESGWNPNATNRSSGACGLVQVYPCSKLANAYDPVVNLTWANGYATGRYGSWGGAYAFWTANHWW